MASGALPAGLTLSSLGQLSGTPTTAGDFNINITVTDINGCLGNQSYAVSVQKANPTVSWNNPRDITYGKSLGVAQLNATANVAGSFVYTPGAGTVLNAGNGQTLSVSFTPADSSNYNTVSAGVLINILKATTVFSNLSSPAITYGTTSTILSGKISTGALIPTGSVSITLNGVTQSAAINSGDGSFSAAFATGSLVVPASPYPISYGYAGDSNFSGTSGEGTLTVSKVNTSTSVGSSSATSIYGQPVTLTATVTSGSGIPRGGIEFFDGATSLGIAVLSNGSASLTTSALAAGSHSISARYLGSANFNISASPALTQAINQAATSTSLTSSLNPSVSGQAVAFNANITSSGGVPFGNVEFFDGMTSLGVVPLNGGSAALTISTLGTGSHQVTAVYGGNSNFLGSTSA